MGDEHKTDQSNVTRLDDTGADKRRYLTTIRGFKKRVDSGVAFGATTGVRIYKFVKPRIGWKQRLRNWFSGD